MQSQSFLLLKFINEKQFTFPDKTYIITFSKITKLTQKHFKTNNTNNFNY